MMFAIMPVLATAVLSSSTIQPITAPSSTATSTPSFVFTRVLPEDNFVVHMVETGEDLKMIAEHHYGNKDFWKNIWNDNPEIADPDSLTEGYMVKIRVPKPEEPVELKEKLKEKWSKLHPVYYYAASTSIKAPSASYPKSAYEEVYKAAGERFGVPWQILYGIHYTETGLRNGEIYNYQGSGAQGPMQFMPGTFRAYGVSADGGMPDINDAEDAIYSAANFIAKHGSIEAGLRYYGGNTPGTLAAARAMGYSN